ncbi:MAG: hypothetical protein ACJAT7_003759 [Psychromonas sp.]|jgi:hypothetical protein|uniref:hypothetical protein n=1 Tax=Psychromonas sp. TaxID=1884585 RepID=UPI0039E25826
MRKFKWTLLFLTTTIFRKNISGAYMASDSRVSFVNNTNNLLQKWIDSKDYKKTVTLDGALYGFAGMNVMFKMFMTLHTGKANSDSLLDALVDFAKQNVFQFFIIRYVDSELKLFAYSPPNPNENNEQEIYRISKDPSIPKDSYAIGSGKHSKKYKRNRLNSNILHPIREIIAANLAGFKKQGMLGLVDNGTINSLTPNESWEAYNICKNNGGDIFTGGEVNMSKGANKLELDKQIKIMDAMDKLAKESGSVCASPVNAVLEIEQLNSLGQYAVSPNQIEKSTEHTALLNKMTKILNASI